MNKHRVLKLIIASGDQSLYLKKMVTADQDARNEWKREVEQNGGWSQELVEAFAKKKGTSPDDLFGEKERLKKFTQHPFEYKSFSSEDWHNFWLITQHCDSYPEFQAKSLQTLRDNLGEDSEEYKYLFDRVRCGKGLKQYYGTQNPQFCQIDLQSPFLEEAKERSKRAYK